MLYVCSSLFYAARLQPQITGVLTLMLKHTGCARGRAGLEYPSYGFMTCFANNRWLPLLQPLLPWIHFLTHNALVVGAKVTDFAI